MDFPIRAQRAGALARSGSLDTINVGEAREQARQMRQMLLAGKDPAIERRERHAEQAKQQAATILFRDAWAEVVAARKGEWKNGDSLRQWSRRSLRLIVQ